MSFDRTDPYSCDQLNNWHRTIRTSSGSTQSSNLVIEETVQIQHADFEKLIEGSAQVAQLRLLGFSVCGLQNTGAVEYAT